MKNKIIQIFILSIFLYNITIILHADDKVSQNGKIKAVFIYNFTKYIKWPKNDISNFFIIGVYGKHSILSFLPEIAQKKMAKGRKILIIEYTDIKYLDKCHILFISSEVKHSVTSVLKQIKYKNILTIGETENFSYQGGMINFIIINGKMKFEMNLKALHRAGLSASSQLLKLAVLVGEKDRKL